MAISVHWVEGGRYATRADTDRAEAAALAALAAAGITDHVAAETAFDAAMDGGDTDAQGVPTHPLAAAWHNAQEAAIAAAVRGWHNPEMGGVHIVAWER
jgi:hypothetical protein